MKTIEQKARAYDKVLEKSKEFYILCKKCGAKDTVDFLEDNFPELVESEDERIKKELIFYLGDMPEDTELRNGVTNRDVLVWLEKQEGCEHIKKDWLEHIKQSWYKEGFIDGKYSGGAPKEWTINDATILKELIDFLENGTTKLQHDLTRYANWLKIQFTPIEKQGEQKPTDEDMKEALKTEYEKGRADAFAQMQKEWSKEDEKMLNHIIGLLEGLPILHNWLKSLKERIGWKPSDEQMENLSRAVNGGSYRISLLMELYQDLKKLKGE